MKSDLKMINNRLNVLLVKRNDYSIVDVLKEKYGCDFSIDRFRSSHSKSLVDLIKEDTQKVLKKNYGIDSRVEIIFNAKEALAKIDEQNYNIIIIDPMIPWTNNRKVGDYFRFKRTLLDEQKKNLKKVYKRKKIDDLSIKTKLKEFYYLSNINYFLTENKGIFVPFYRLIPIKKLIKIINNKSLDKKLDLILKYYEEDDNLKEHLKKDIEDRTDILREIEMSKLSLKCSKKIKGELELKKIYENIKEEYYVKKEQSIQEYCLGLISFAEKYKNRYYHIHIPSFYKAMIKNDKNTFFEKSLSADQMRMSILFYTKYKIKNFWWRRWHKDLEGEGLPFGYLLEDDLQKRNIKFGIYPTHSLSGYLSFCARLQTNPRILDYAIELNRKNNILNLTTISSLKSAIQIDRIRNLRTPSGLKLATLIDRSSQIKKIVNPDDLIFPVNVSAENGKIIFSDEERIDSIYKDYPKVIDLMIKKGYVN